MRRFKLLLIIITVMLIPLCWMGVGYQNPVQAQNTSNSTTSVALGDPLPGLSSKELGRFRSGQSEFERHHSVQDGLGPIFNGDSCVQCHGEPVSGGGLSDKKDLTLRIGRLKKNGQYDPLKNLGGEPLSFNNHVSGCDQQVIPMKPGLMVSHRAAQPLFGFGLIDAIPDQVILSHVIPVGKDPDGISGRPNIVKSIHFGNMRVGRFGWKAHMPTLNDFSSDAYLVEIGITSPDLPVNRKPNGFRQDSSNPNSQCGDKPGPEDFDGRVTSAFVDFMALLAPPTPQPLNAVTQQGRQIFTDIGCAKCHIPTMITGTLSDNPNLISPVIANQNVNLYSDLLLHDMGKDLEDGIETEMATGSEWRTQPLWGLSHRKFLLHDGRTNDIPTAIMMHGGESEIIRNRFINLNPKDKNALISFLQSL